MFLPKDNKNNKRPRIGKIISVFVCLLAVSSSLLLINPAPARADLPVIDLLGNALNTGKTVWDKIQAVLKVLWQKGASVALQTAVRNTLNTLAYDSATWAGSGFQGQKPQWLTNDIGTTMEKVGDSAAGDFIGKFANELSVAGGSCVCTDNKGNVSTVSNGDVSDADCAAYGSKDEGVICSWQGGGPGFNICSPSLGAKLAIGLGLVGQVRPPAPDCTASEMVKNWTKTISSNDKNFLKNFAGYFDVSQNDLGAALTSQTSFLSAQQTAKLNQSLSLQSNGPWLDVRTIGGQIKGTPGQAKTSLETAQISASNNIGKFTGDALVDAMNVFLNQLAVTAFQNAMKKLTESVSKSGALSSITSPYGSPSGGNQAAAQGALRKVIQPQFGSTGDFDILNQLTLCNTGVFGVGPTDCVIDQNFRQAVAKGETVAEALADGSLNGNAPFGFMMGGDKKPIEPVWNQGYPYRSLAILRKYRIIPVGWELAAQYMQVHPDDVANHNNLKDLVACYDSHDSYTGYNDDGVQAWCQGLVDPSWVMKAPQNYCAKAGYGPQILNSQVVAQGVDAKQNKLPAQLLVTRADNYCGDEKSCLKENSDGSCKYFGYCSEDRRLWKFGSDSCDAQYNTCQAFTNEAGTQVAYLKNSLQYCDQTQAGCERYARASADGYNILTGSLDWTKSAGNIYLNKNAGECDQAAEGCHQFIRIASGLGTNLIRNSGFEQNDSSDVIYDSGAGNGDFYLVPAGWKQGDSFESEKIWWLHDGESSSITSNSPVRDGKALHVVSSFSPAGIDMPDRSDSSKISIFPPGFVMEPEVSYTFSADIYNVSADRVDLTIGRGSDYWETKSVTSKNTWETVSVTINNNASILANEAIIFGWSASNNIDYYVDNIKFEIGGQATAYSDYAGNNLIYEKFMPAYLRPVCFNDPDHGDYSPKSGAPAACAQFARPCSRDEAGCELYTKTADRSQTTAAVRDANYCPAECDGYSALIRTESKFSSNFINYFIPATAKTCSAAAAGCTEFTNLASTTAGGEQKEYYTALRQCVKPSDPGVFCGDFYSWEGSASQGQQLVKYGLEQDGAGKLLPADDPALCGDAIYKKLPGQSGYNFDCRQFYDKNGAISYRLYSQTVTCSADCHSYRLAKENIDPLISDGNGCTLADNAYFALTGKHIFFWDGAANGCVHCLNGGVWDGAQGGCVYQAYLPESAACSADNSGCSEYTGNQGANVRTISASYFEIGAEDWTGGAITKNSVVAGQNAYRISGSAPINDDAVAAWLVQGAPYTITFLAKAESEGASLSVAFDNNGSYSYFSSDEKVLSVPIAKDIWRQYQLSLPQLIYDPFAPEALQIRLTGGTAVDIDNVVLAQVTDRYYLISDSWKTPASCDKDFNGNPYPLYMLGCSQYSDRLGNTDYLHSFDRVCQRSAAGCEAIIDTADSATPGADDSYVSAHGAAAAIPADRLVYAQYDPDKLCGAPDKGCERLGKAADYAGETVYKDAYLKNDPDRYGNILCDASGVGCNLFNSSDGQAYFKEPGDMVCEWRQAAGVGASNGWGWWKKKIKRCGPANSPTGNACLANKDCTGGQTCQMETLDNACPVEKLKTIGQGGPGNETLQPGSDGVYNWAGICPAEQTGCTEYLDPVSDFSGNIIYNSDFSQDVDKSAVADGWEDPGNSLGMQKINFDGNSLYVLTAESKDANYFATVKSSAYPINSGQVIFYVLGADNNFSAAADSVTVKANQSTIFYAEKPVKGGSITVSKYYSPSTNKVILRKVLADYQLSGGVDKKDCNGKADAAAGCVFFNERSVNTSSGGLKAFDASMNPWVNYGVSAINQVNNNGTMETNPSFANILLKVKPDRTCNQWLACKSYVKDENNKNVCFDIANCDRLDDSGNCLNFPVNQKAANNRTYDPNDISNPNMETPDSIKNLTGYVKVGLAPANPVADFKNLPGDLLNFGSMKQAGKTVIVPNGDFELSEATTTDPGKTWVSNPDNWRTAGGERWTATSADALYSVVSDPVTAQNLGIPYPMIGKSFLKYSANPEATVAGVKNFPKSSLIYLRPNEDYYLSFYINTSGLRGDANVKSIFRVLNEKGTDVVPVMTSKLTADKLNGWVLKTQRFIAPVSGIVYLEPAASADASGYIYLDDIQIAPALKVKTGDIANNVPDLYDRQTCRVYPGENSLSCDYYDDTGALHKGDHGYCLEYDRPPGDPNSCILWWPIDKVKGSGIQSATAKGYTGLVPLYYCIGANVKGGYPHIAGTDLTPIASNDYTLNVNNTPVDRNPASDYFLSYEKNVMTAYFHGYNKPGVTHTYFYLAGKIHYLEIDGSDAEKSFNFSYMFQAFKNARKESGETVELPNGDSFKVDFDCGDYANDVGLGDCKGLDGIPLYQYISNVNAPNTNKCVHNFICKDGSHSITMTYTFYLPLACNKLAQVVDSNGQNKAWVDRVGGGSNYSLPCNVGMPSSYILSNGSQVNVDPAPPGNCVYSTPTLPFGRANMPAGTPSFQSDPSFWTQPLPYDLKDSVANAASGQMGQLQTADSLSYLFAESYGVWDWNGNSYIQNPLEDWHQPLTRCAGNIRSTATDNCAVAPTVTNLKLNNAVGSASTYLFGRGFVNLTFNSKIDSQQSPLAAYEIDWGDNESLSVTGADMADRPNPDDPHSVYYAYDYYDLLSKFNSNKLQNDDEVPTLVCRSDGLKNFCKVKPRVRLIDNWGWCTEGFTKEPCPAIIPESSVGGVCKNSSGTTWPSGLHTCFGDYVLDSNDRSKLISKHCPSDYSMCADGWWESGGYVIVYEPGT